MDKGVLRKWLKTGYFERGTLHETEAGTPQGGILSPVLANMTLDGLERSLRMRFGRMPAAKVNMVRYADDFIVTGGSKELLENEVKPHIQAFLGERGLTLSEEKICVTNISEGLDFLGQNLRKYDGKLLIKPSKANVKAFLKKTRDIIRNNRQATTENLINLLNPVIQGWVNYHRHVVSKETFGKVDHALWKTLYSGPENSDHQSSKIGRWFERRFKRGWEDGNAIVLKSRRRSPWRP